MNEKKFVTFCIITRNQNELKCIIFMLCQHCRVETGQPTRRHIHKCRPFSNRKPQKKDKSDGSWFNCGFFELVCDERLYESRFLQNSKLVMRSVMVLDQENPKMRTESPKRDSQRIPTPILYSRVVQDLDLVEMGTQNARRSSNSQVQNIPDAIH